MRLPIGLRAAMPATPAWPPKSLPRLFVRQPLGEGAQVELDAAQANYLGNVLRLKEGAELLTFDGSSGEWLARIAEAGKKRMALDRRAPDARAGNDPRRLARIRAGQAPGHGLAGRESDRARRRQADPGDDPADGGRAGEARAPGSDRHRSSRAMRPDGPARDRRAACSSKRCSKHESPRERSISPTKAAASHQRTPSARPSPDPDRPRGRLHRRGEGIDPCRGQCRPRFAWPTHPSRRNRSPRRAGRIHGRRRRLAPAYRPIRWNRWRGPLGAANRALE